MMTPVGYLLTVAYEQDGTPRTLYCYHLCRYVWDGIMQVSRYDNVKRAVVINVIPIQAESEYKAAENQLT